jgi:hypothetical protein
VARPGTVNATPLPTASPPQRRTQRAIEGLDLTHAASLAGDGVEQVAGGEAGVIRQRGAGLGLEGVVGLRRLAASRRW